MPSCLHSFMPSVCIVAALHCSIQQERAISSAAAADLTGKCLNGVNLIVFVLLGDCGALAIMSKKIDRKGSVVWYMGHVTLCLFKGYMMNRYSTSFAQDLDLRFARS